MKIYTSNFYQIRNFTLNMVPVATTAMLPKWFRTADGKTYTDKRGVLNGLRIFDLALPENVWRELEVKGSMCSKECPHIEEVPHCGFMDAYREYLDTLNFEAVMFALNQIAENYCKPVDTTVEPVIVLIVFESRDCICAERPVIQEWFKKHGVEVTEWTK